MNMTEPEVGHMGKWQDRFDALQRSVDEWLRDVAGAARSRLRGSGTPEPELVPVPVRVPIPRR
ncbi:MAG: hypothetical protein ABMB14_11380 [Myxococcota bacterium]